MDSVQGKSSPGYPWNVASSAGYSTNAQLLAAERLTVKKHTVATILALLKLLDCEADDPEVDEARSLIAGFVKVFIKKEPHPMRKAKEGRWRIICSVSIISQLVERVFFAKQNYAEIGDWGNLPAKPGMGHTDEGLDVLTANIEDLHKRLGALCPPDARGFDMSCKGWMHRAEARLRARAYGYDPRGIVGQLFQLWFNILSEAVFVFSDGVTAQLSHPSIQFSGRYCTSSGNTWMRLLMITLCKHLNYHLERAESLGYLAQDVCEAAHPGGSQENVRHDYVAICWQALGYLALEEWDCPKPTPVEGMAMGDDAIEAWRRYLCPIYEGMGFEMKSYSPIQPGDAVAFCSTVFQDGDLTPYPENPGKLYARLLAHPKLVPELIEQFGYDMRHHPELSKYTHHLALLISEGVVDVGAPRDVDAWLA